MHCHHHHHHHHHHDRMWRLLYLSRYHAEEPGPPTVYEMVATVIAGLAMLAALGALAVLMAGVLFALVVAFVA